VNSGIWEEEEELRKANLARMGLMDSSLLQTPSSNKRKRGNDPISPLMKERKSECNRGKGGK
jgi:hypothetical protein